MSGTETPGGDREGMVTVRGEGLAYLGCMGVETWKWLLDHPEMDAPALDRLMAQHRDTQEALRWAQRLVTLDEHRDAFSEDEEAEIIDGLRAALASVRARTPQ